MDVGLSDGGAQGTSHRFYYPAPMDPPMPPGFGKHAGHTSGMFRDRFGLSLLLTLPILYFDAHFQPWFGYQAVQFPGVSWVQPLLSVVLYIYDRDRRGQCYASAPPAV